MNLTTIIQGPLHQNSINAIEYYAKFGKVIVSCYNNDDITLIKSKTCKIVTSSIPKLPFFNSGNLFYQLLTTYNGIKNADTKYIIKTRSDESWGNIEPFIKKMINNEDKYTSCNIYFKGTMEPLHPSDHMFGGKKEYFEKGFKYTLEQCIKYPNNLHGSIFNTNWINGFAVGEVPIFLSFLYGKNITKDLTENNQNQITFDNTELVNIDEMKPYIWSCTINSKRYYWTDSSDLYHTYPSLKTKEEFWRLKYE